VVNGEPGTAFSMLPLIENTEMLLDPWFATNRNLPPGSMASPMGVVPAFVVVATAVSDPSAFVV
jgi:hypothetical protein